MKVEGSILCLPFKVFDTADIRTWTRLQWEELINTELRRMTAALILCLVLAAHWDTLGHTGTVGGSE